MTVRWRTPIASPTADEPAPLDDEALIRRAQEHPDTFQAVFERYGAEIQRYILSRINGPLELAEDLTSQVFLRAWAALPTYQSGSLRGWLYQIARNIVIDHVRRRRLEVPLTAVATIASTAHSIEDGVVANEARAQLHSALETLSDQQRSVIQLRLQGHTGVEIATQLGLSHDAVRSAQYRAMTTLRRTLAHLYLRDDE